MKITDVICRLLLIAVSLFCMPAHAQLSRIVGKQAAKETYKTAVKEGAKEYVVKEATHAASKEALEEISETAAKKAASNTISKIASKSAKELIGTDLRKSAVKGVTEKAVKNAARNNSALATGVKKSAEAECKKLTTEANKRVAPNAAKKNTQHAVKEKVGKEAVEETLGKRAAEEWMKKTGGDPVKTKTLIEDVEADPHLRDALSQNPALLDPYLSMIGSPYRKEIKHLRYIANNADKGHSTYTRPPRSKVLTNGKDLEYKDVRGKTHIVDKNTGETWGTIRKDANGEDVVELKKMKNNPLTSDLYPMANTTYEGSNFTIKTDRYGRVWKVKCWIDKNILKDIDKFRDDGGKDTRNIRNRVKNFKSNYDVNGLQKPKETYDDASGHLVANSWGGGTNLLNLIPQLNAMNKSGSWWYSERQGLQEAENGKKVIRLIELFYQNRSTMRPSKLVVTQTVNGKIQMVKHSKTNAVLEMEAVAFNNMTNAINKKPFRSGRTKRR